MAHKALTRLGSKSSPEACGSSVAVSPVLRAASFHDSEPRTPRLAEDPTASKLVSIPPPRRKPLSSSGCDRRKPLRRVFPVGRAGMVWAVSETRCRALRRGSRRWRQCVRSQK